MADQPIFLAENTAHPTRDHIGASVLDFAAARAKRQQLAATGVDVDFAFDFEAFLADAEAEQKLPRERLAPEALAELRRDLITAMSGPLAGGRASVLHSVLYAMVRELLDARACILAVCGCQEALQKRRISRAEFDQDIEHITLCARINAEQEILCNLAIVLGGGAA